jgi:hypothetical protein
VLVTKREPLSDPASDDAARTPAAEEVEREVASDVAEMLGVSFAEVERETVRVHLAMARADTGLDPALAGPPDAEAAALRSALPAIAETLPRPADELAGQLAVAAALSDRYRAFLTDHDLSPLAPPDRRAVAREALAALTRRRERIEQKLAAGGTALGPGHRRREQLEHELEEIERLEAEHWTILHPAALGSPHGGAGQSSDTEPGEQLHFCRCGAEISRQTAYRVGLCDPCRATYHALKGRPPPVV